MEIKIKEDSGRYDLKGNLAFLDAENDEKVIKINFVDALEIAYTLFDWAGMPYTLLDEINERIEEPINNDYTDDDTKFWEEVDLAYEEYERLKAQVHFMNLTKILKRRFGEKKDGS